MVVRANLQKWVGCGVAALVVLTTGIACGGGEFIAGKNRHLSCESNDDCLAGQLCLPASGGGKQCDFPRIAAGMDVTCVLNPQNVPRCWGQDIDSEFAPTEAAEHIAIEGDDYGSVCILRKGSGELECTEGYKGTKGKADGAYFDVALAENGPVCTIARDNGRTSCLNSTLSGRKFKRFRPGEFLDIEVDGEIACGIRQNKKLVCGTVGFGSVNSPNIQNVRDFAFDDGGISSGNLVGCAVLENGSLECFGNAVATLGLDAKPGGSFQQIVMGNSSSTDLYACGLGTGGGVECWGGPDAVSKNEPLSKFRSLAGGATHVCGVRNDGSIDCWGENPSFDEGNPVTSVPRGLRVGDG